MFPSHIRWYTGVSSLLLLALAACVNQEDLDAVEARHDEDVAGLSTTDAGCAADVENLQGQVTALTDALASAVARLDEAESHLASIESSAVARLDAAESRLASIEGDVSGFDKQIDGVWVQLDDLDARVSTNSVGLSDLAVLLARETDLGPTQVYLSADTSGRPCVEYFDSSYYADPDCAPEGFTDAGVDYQDGVFTGIYLEEEPSADRAVWNGYTTAAGTGESCIDLASPSDCCPSGFEFVGYGVRSYIVVCLESLP